MDIRRSLRYFLFALALGTLFGCTTPVKTTPFTGKNDTVFLKKIAWEDKELSNYTFWNKVYLDPEHHSKRRDAVLDFSGMNSYLNDYNTKNLKHFDTSMFPDEWVPLYKYKGKYYIYAPGDSDLKFAVRDSLFISYFHEPTYFAIEAFKKVGKNHYRLQTKSNVLPETIALPEFNIYIVDPVKNIAVWQQAVKSSGEREYYLFIAKESTQNFALVVNDASDKPDEFKFDPIDFKKLLRSGGFGDR